MDRQRSFQGQVYESATGTSRPNSGNLPFAGQRYVSASRPNLDKFAVRERMRVISRQALDEYEIGVNGRPPVSSVGGDTGSEQFVVLDQRFIRREPVRGLPMESTGSAKVSGTRPRGLLDWNQTGHVSRPTPNYVGTGNQGLILGPVGPMPSSGPAEYFALSLNIGVSPKILRQFFWKMLMFVT